MQEQQYKILNSYILTDRTGDEKFHINNNIIELVLYEHLEKPFVTGQVAISDDVAFFDTMRFSGTERLVIETGGENENRDVVLTRTFVMTGIDRIEKGSTSGSSGIYLFSLIDEHAIISKTKKISRSVRGNLLTETQNLILGELGKDIDLSYSLDPTQANIKAIIPYMNPLEAATWMLNRLTSEAGLPYFLYASIHDDNLRIGNLEKMLEQDAWNAKARPYLYSPAGTQLSEDGDNVDQNFIIQSMKATKMQNTFNQFMTGGIGSEILNTNLSSGRVSKTKFDINKLLKDCDDRGIIDIDKQNIYDPMYKPERGLNNKTLSEYSSRVFHTLTSTGTYQDFKSIHDEYDAKKFKKKIDNLAFRNMLYKNMFDVTVPGAGFTASKASVGDIVQIRVLNDEVDTESGRYFDTLRSGDFLIYNVRHTFRDTRHDVAMTVCKLERGSPS